MLLGELNHSIFFFTQCSLIAVWEERDSFMVESRKASQRKKKLDTRTPTKQFGLIIDLFQVSGVLLFSQCRSMSERI